MTAPKPPAREGKVERRRVWTPKRKELRPPEDGLMLIMMSTKRVLTTRLGGRRMTPKEPKKKTRTPKWRKWTRVILVTPGRSEELPRRKLMKAKEEAQIKFKMTKKWKWLKKNVLDDENEAVGDEAFDIADFVSDVDGADDVGEDGDENV